MTDMYRCPECGKVDDRGQYVHWMGSHNDNDPCH
jgi:hypothetical protein